MQTILYKQHATGKIGQWKIWDDGYTIYMETRVNPNACPTVRQEKVKEGKACRTRDEQVESRMRSRINAKLDGGYRHTEAEAREHAGANAANLPRPMLASSKIATLANASSIYAQPKLDGMRLIIHRDGDEVLAYSRNGKPVDTVPHVLEDARTFLKRGEFLDGELYQHGKTLQSIMSLAKRKQLGSKRLRFHMFDVISDAAFSTRFNYMVERLQTTNVSSITAVDTVLLADLNVVPDLLNSARATGFEGLILRDGEASYGIGKRSPKLVKVKQFFDFEALVLEVTTGDKGMPVLVCATADYKTFRVTAPGNHAEKQFALDNPELYVSQYVKIRHAGYTSKGIPFHPVCLGLHEAE